MRNIFLLFWAFSLSLFAQHPLTVQYNLPREGDFIEKYCVEYQDPGREGANVFWNFSKLKVVDDAYTLEYSQYGDTIIGVEHQMMYYYRFKEDTLLINGYENRTTFIENVRPEIVLVYPFSFQDSIHCYFQGKGKYCNELQLDMMGTVTTKADAYGMMILPEGDTLRNVVRVKSYKRIAEASTSYSRREYERNRSLPAITNDSIEYRLATDTAIIELETIRWYEKGYRYPVFETVRSAIVKEDGENKFFNLAFYYPPQDHYYLEEDEDNLLLLEQLAEEARQQKEKEAGEEEKEIFTYNVWLDNGGNQVEVEYYLSEYAEVTLYLCDIQGKVHYVIPKKVNDKGYYQETLPLTDILTKQYILRITVNERNYSDVIIK